MSALLVLFNRCASSRKTSWCHIECAVVSPHSRVSSCASRLPSIVARHPRRHLHLGVPPLTLPTLTSPHRPIFIMKGSPLGIAAV